MGILSWRNRESEPAAAGAGTRGVSAGAGPSPVELVERAQAGDGGAREDLIRAYQPFVMRVAAEACGRYVSQEDDEASIALIAFNEAISGYQAGKGGSFLKFAETVIKRRLIDYFRKQGGRREVPLTDLEIEDDEGEAYLPAEAEAAVTAHQVRQEVADRRDEIVRYQAVLQGFGITFQELASLSPKHRDARESAKRVARAIAGNPNWADALRRNRSLPLRELERDTGLGVSRKTLERNRKYIIAVALLLLEDFEHLRSYAAFD